MRAAGQPVMSRPSKTDAAGARPQRPDTVLSSVLLPAPLGPISATTPPAGTARSTPRTASMRP